MSPVRLHDRASVALGEDLRGHIRESFKKWTAGFDFGQRI